jgi:uncharacterized protein
VEKGADLEEAARAAGEELRLLAGWLDLPDIAVRPKGDLARHLSL